MANEPMDLKYPMSQKVITCALMPFLSVCAFLLGLFAFRADEIMIGIFSWVFSALMAFLSAFGSLATSSIAISDTGIAATNFGRKLKFIPWANVTKVKKVRRLVPGFGSYQSDFYVFDQDFPPFRERLVNLRGPILFSDRIIGFPDLLARINVYAERHQFRLFVVDQEEIRKVAARAKPGTSGPSTSAAHGKSVSQF